MAKWEPQGLQGLSGLSAQDQKSFIDRQVEAGTLPKDYRYVEADRLYRNGQFIDTFDMSTFLAIPNPEERDKLFKEKYVNSAIEENYSNDSVYRAISNLTLEGKQELLDKGYINEEEINSNIEKFNSATSSGFQPVGGIAAMGMPTPTPESVQSDYARHVTANNNSILEGVIVRDNKRKVAQCTPEINSRISAFKQGQQTWVAINNEFNNITSSNDIDEKDVDQVIDQLEESLFVNGDQAKKLKDLSPDKKVNIVGQIIQESNFNPARIDILFDKIALPRQEEVELPYTINEDGSFSDTPSTVTVNYPGSRTYNSLRGTRKLKSKEKDSNGNSRKVKGDLNQSEKLQQIITWQTLAERAGEDSAISNLETSLMEIVDDRENARDWGDDVFRGITIGGVANIANKVNGIHNIWVAAKYGEKGLANVLDGKNPDGSDKEDDGSVKSWAENNALNPRYWKGVEEYQTFDPLEIKAISENGGVSPYVNMRLPDQPFTFGEMATEAIKMTKFLWSDMLVNAGLGRATSGLGKLGTVGRVAGKAVAAGTYAGMGVGIAESYGMMTYDKTYEAAKEKNNDILDKDKEAYIEDKINSEEGQKFIDSEVSKYMDMQNKLVRENSPKLSEESIREQVVNSLRYSIADAWDKDPDKQVLKDTLDEDAKLAASTSYMVDATIEWARMSAFNSMFKSWMFSQATKEALGTGNGLFSTKVVNGEAKLARKVLDTTASAASQVLGGFTSNYFDDVTVAFGYGFGLGRYNNLVAEYNDPENLSKGLETSNWFLAGLKYGDEEASKALADKQSFIDGAIGAMGTVTGIMPVFSRSTRSSIMDSMGVTKDTKPNLFQWTNAHFTNALLRSYYEAKAKGERTQKVLDSVNSTMKEQSSKLEDISRVVSFMSDPNTDAPTVIALEDQKDREAFQLVYSTSKAGESEIIGEFPVMQQAEETLARLAKGEATEAEISRFLAEPSNAELAKQEGAREEAAKRLQKNASRFMEMQKKVTEATERINSTQEGRNIPESLKEQYIYMLSMGDAWRDRVNSMEESLTGSTPYQKSTSLKDRLASIFKGGSRSTNPVALYGTKGQAEREYEAYLDLIYGKKNSNGERVSSSKSLIGQLNFAQQLIDKAEKSLENDENLTSEQRASIESEIEAFTLKAKQLKASISNLKSLAQEAKTASEKLANKEEFEVLTADEILHLDPVTRAKMMSEANRSNYSKAQQREIEKLSNQLLAKDSQALHKIRDIAALTQRIEANDNSYSLMVSNPGAALSYVTRMNSDKNKAIAEAIISRELENNLIKAISAENIERAVNILFGDKKYAPSPEFIQNFMKKFPGSESRYLEELSKLAQCYTDLEGSISELYKGVSNGEKIKATWVEYLYDKVKGLTSVDEIVNTMEDLVDNLEDGNSRLIMDSILEGMKNRGYTRNSTKVREREKEAERKILIEKQRKVEEDSKDGKNFNWEGYKVGDTVYFKHGAKGVVTGFETTPNGDTKMVVENYNGKTRGVYRFDSKIDKDRVSKSYKEEEEVVQDTKVPPIQGPEIAPLEEEPINNPAAAIQSGEAEYVDLFDTNNEGETESPSVETQARAAGVEVQEIPAEDASRQGNAITEGDGVASGNKYSMLSTDALIDHRLEEAVPTKDNSVFEQVVNFVHSTKTSLQEIIDKEFLPFISKNPDTPIRFMLVNPKGRTANEYKLQTILFPVIEYTSEVKKLHNEDRGGVFNANGKQWLLVGSLGISSKEFESKKQALDDMTFPVRQRRGGYFKAHPNEEYFVDDIAVSKVVDITSGRLITSIEGEESKTRTLGELLSDSSRNPNGYTMSTVDFGIQIGDKFASTYTGKDTVYPPENSSANSGRVFILVDTVNGNKIPAMLDSVTLNEIDKTSDLYSLIQEELMKITSSDFATRDVAKKRLGTLLNLNKNSSNILIGTEKIPTVTVLRHNVPIATFKVGSNFDRNAFLQAVNDADFRINFTLQNLADSEFLKIADAAGALRTNISQLSTAGGSFTLQMLDKQGKPVVVSVERNSKPGEAATPAKTTTAVKLNGTVYETSDGLYFRDRGSKKEVTYKSPLWTSCYWNNLIIQNKWEPYCKNGNNSYYLVSNSENPGVQFLIKRDTTENITELSVEESSSIIAEVESKIAAANQRKTLQEMKGEDVDLGEILTTPPPQAKRGQISEEKLTKQLLGDFAPEEPITPSPAEVAKAAQHEDVAKPKKPITTLSKKRVGVLESTNKLTTFAQIVTSRELRGPLMEVLQNKGWGIDSKTTTAAIEKVLKDKNIVTSNIEDVQSWLDLIKNCR